MGRERTALRDLSTPSPPSVRLHTGIVATRVSTDASRCPKHEAMPTDYQLLVVVRFLESGQYQRAYDVYLRLSIVNDSRRRSDDSVSPFMDRFCGGGIDEILDRDLSIPGSHGRYFKGFVSGDSRTRTLPGAQIFRSQLTGMRRLQIGPASRIFPRGGAGRRVERSPVRVEA